MFAFGHVFERDSFLSLLDLEIKRARRYQDYVSLLSLTFNHLPFSATENPGISLKTMANLIVDDVRETDIVGLKDRNHLIVMMPYADMVASGKVKARLRQLLQDYGFDKKGNTIEINEACFPTHASDIEELLRRIDCKLSKNWSFKGGTDYIDR